MTKNPINIPITEPEKINFQELMNYYGFKGKFGSIKLKNKILKNMILQSLAERSPTPNLTIKFQRWKGVNIGNHVYIGPKTFIDILYPHLIHIEDYVSIGYSMIFAHSNPTCSYLIKTKVYPRYVKPVFIKHRSWIGAGCIILPGVTIGENSIIGAGSLVNKDIPPCTLAAGHPAKPIKKLKLEN